MLPVARGAGSKRVARVQLQGWSTIDAGPARKHARTRALARAHQSIVQCRGALVRTTGAGEGRLATDSRSLQEVETFKSASVTACALRLASPTDMH